MDSRWRGNDSVWAMTPRFHWGDTLFRASQRRDPVAEPVGVDEVGGQGGAVPAMQHEAGGLLGGGGGRIGAEVERDQWGHRRRDDHQDPPPELLHAAMVVT